MNKKIFILLGVLYIFGLSDVHAQNFTKPEPLYRTSAGVKMGNLYQVSAKFFINSDLAFDFSGGFSFSNTTPLISMVFEYHHEMKYENIFWYYGAGPVFSLKRFNNEVGFAAVFGGEIVTREKFITIFAEIQPFVITRIGNFSFSQNIELNPRVLFSAGVRYIFS